MKLLVPALVIVMLGAAAIETGAGGDEMLIDDFTRTDLVSRLGTRWRAVSDRVMGGISDGSITRECVAGRSGLRLAGEVRLENNGGFIQAALDLAPPGESFDGSAYAGVRLVVRGNGERYSLHIRTPDNVRPWQSYRASFIAGPAWTTIEIPFSDFRPYRLDAPLDVSRLRRIGLVAIGRAFNADLAISEISFHR